MPPCPVARAATFPKEARLRRSGEFRQVLSQGNKYGGPTFLLYWLPTANPTRVGLTVSRKVGNAVTRNRVKRLVREYFRQSVQHGASQRDYVVIAKPPAGLRNNGELVQELDRLFRASLAITAKKRSGGGQAAQGK